VSDVDDLHLSITEPDSKDDVEEVAYWATCIYARLEAAFETQKLDSFFIPGNNLLSDDSKYKYHKDLAVTYAKTCRLMLTAKEDIIFGLCPK
jgi:hypothetical protein